MQSISIIGVGRLGGALAIALAKNGFMIENLAARNRDNIPQIKKIIKQNPQILAASEFAKIGSEIIFITVQDFEIANVVKNLAKTLKHQPFVFHTSGSLSSDILRPVKKIGCRTGSIHPLVSVSDPVRGAGRFSEAYFCLEGETDAKKKGEEIVEKLGGTPFSIATKFKTLYHASAVTASGHLVALIDTAIEMLSNCGLSPVESQKILLPLIKSTVENLGQQKTSEALTGTFARADSETFGRHLKSLERTGSDEILEVYLQLGARSLHLAEVQGANRENLEKLRKEISLAKKNLK